MVRALRVLLLFLMIISTGGVYYQFFSTEINVLSLVLAITLLFFTKISRKVFTIQTIIAILSLFLLFALHYILHLKNSLLISDYFSLFTRIFITIVLLYHYKTRNENFIHEFYYLLLIIVAHGALNFFAVDLFPGNIIEWKSSISEYTTYTLAYLFFVSDRHLVLRNCGLFWEPGVFQLFINLFLFIQLFVFRKGKFSVFLFGALMILSTQSTLGIIIFVILTLSYFYSSLNLKRILLLVMLFILSFFVFLPNIRAKFSGVYKISYQARVFDTATGIYAIINRPLLGYGYYPKDNSKITINSSNYQKGIKSARLSYIQKRGNTNSIIMNFVYWGIPIGIWFLYLLYKQSLFERYTLLFFLICFLTCISEPLLFSGIFLLFTFSSFFRTHEVSYEIVNENS